MVPRVRNESVLERAAISTPTDKVATKQQRWSAECLKVGSAPICSITEPNKVGSAPICLITESNKVGSAPICSITEPSMEKYQEVDLGT